MAVNQLTKIQPAKVLVMPDQRGKGWIKYMDLVLFVHTIKGVLWIRTGHIASWPGSHGVGFEIDNFSKTIVWSDESIRDCDHFDDCHEKTFKVNDPLLIRRDEVHFLQDGKLALKWFHGTLAPCEIYRVHRLLKQSDFGLAEEMAYNDTERLQLLPRLKALESWWHTNTYPHPVLGRRASLYWGE
jgi:hypothetical protein